MKLCKFCGHPMEWGREGNRWVGLVPVGADDNLDRTHQDENGNLRALHKSVCNYKVAVKVTRLEHPVPAHAIMPQSENVEISYEVAVTEPPKKKRKYKSPVERYQENMWRNP